MKQKEYVYNTYNVDELHDYMHLPFDIACIGVPLWAEVQREKDG